MSCLSAISIDNRIKLIEEFRKADVVLLTYACDQPSTLDRLSSYWLPELRRLEVSLTMDQIQLLTQNITKKEEV